MLLYLCLYYNSIQALFCFALFFRFFVCFSSASANYRIQLIYLLAILDSSFARGAKQRVCSLNIALMDRRSFDGLCEAGLGSIGLASGLGISPSELSVCTCLGIIITSTSDRFRISDILLYFYLMLCRSVPPSSPFQFVRN